MVVQIVDTEKLFQANIYRSEISKPNKPYKFEYRITVDEKGGAFQPEIGGFIPFHLLSGHMSKDEVRRWIAMQAEHIRVSKSGTVKYDDSCKAVLEPQESRQPGKIPTFGQARLVVPTDISFRRALRKL